MSLRRIKYLISLNFLLICGQLEHRLHKVVQRLRTGTFFLGFQGRPDDIYIVSHMKSGTTWMQMMLYQLTTDGAMNFKHIYDISPYLEAKIQSGLGKTVFLDDLPSPRLFKSHMPYRFFPKGLPGRFVYLLRDGRDVAISQYHHHKAYREISSDFEEFFETFLEISPGRWFKHVADWLNNKRKHHVLYVKYEDMKTDFEREMRRVIDFCAFQVDPAEYPRVMERCSFQFMKRHESRFGAIRQEAKRHDQFIRKGQVGEGAATLTPEQKARYEERFQACLGSFEALREYSSD